MAVLVTRPAPENLTTAASLAARGFDVLLSPMLIYQALPLRDDPEARYSGTIVTSANALRAVAGHPLVARLIRLPLFAVGQQTARSAKELGFAKIVEAGGHALSLRDSVMAHDATATAKAPWLYLAAADVSRDLAAELRARNVPVATRQVYRMAMAQSFPAEVVDALARQEVEVVLHYSRRSAEAFIAAARQAGLEISALALPQCCLSERIAQALREAGSSRVAVASEPREEALLTVLERTAGLSRRT